MRIRGKDWLFELDSFIIDDMSKWACNIGRGGRILRFIISLILLAAGVWLVFYRDSAFWGTGLLALGAFVLFEAARGWCALRSLGINTPL